MVPTNAIPANNLQTLTTWQASFDTGTGNGSSTSSGVISLASEPSLSGSALEFDTSYTNNGGERYFVNFGADTASQNFFYDTWVYLDSDTTAIANLEFDMNQVMANGQTVIYGFQCDGYSNTWDYTENSGKSPTAYVDTWVHSSASCNPQNWATQTWHHVQVYYSRDEQGDVSYNTVWLDGVEQQIYATVPSAFSLNWGPALVTNFQVDGKGAGGNPVVYTDNLSIYRW